MDKKRKKELRKHRKLRGNAHKVNWIKEKAKELNVNTPKSELWYYDFLARHNCSIPFEKNIPIQAVGKFYIVDLIYDTFIIEIDGSIHDLPEVIENDKKKDKALKSLGYTVFRVKHGDEKSALQSLEYLYAYIADKNKITQDSIKRKLEYKKKQAKIQKKINSLPKTEFNVSHKGVNLKQYRCSKCQVIGCHKVVKISNKTYQVCVDCYTLFMEYVQSLETDQT